MHSRTVAPLCLAVFRGNWIVLLLLFYFILLCLDSPRLQSAAVAAFASLTLRYSDLSLSIILIKCMTQKAAQNILLGLSFGSSD